MTGTQAIVYPSSDCMTVHQADCTVALRAPYLPGSGTEIRAFLAGRPTGPGQSDHANTPCAQGTTGAARATSRIWPSATLGRTKQQQETGVNIIHPPNFKKEGKVALLRLLEGQMALSWLVVTLTSAAITCTVIQRIGAQRTENKWRAKEGSKTPAHQRRQSGGGCNLLTSQI